MIEKRTRSFRIASFFRTFDLYKDSLVNHGNYKKKSNEMKKRTTKEKQNLKIHIYKKVDMSDRQNTQLTNQQTRPVQV